jgi:predicted nucleic acid-binding protein
VPTEMHAMHATDVVADANIALKWFHAAGEQEVEPARALLTRHRDRRVALHVLDLTPYELGNALLRGHSSIDGERVAEVLNALADMCTAIVPGPQDLREACLVAEQHDLTLYDAAYAAVAKRRDAQLVTLDDRLLESGLGHRPAELLELLDDPPG